MDYFKVEKESASQVSSATISAATSPAASPDPLLPPSPSSASMRETMDGQGSARIAQAAHGTDEKSPISDTIMPTQDPVAATRAQLSQVLLPRQKWAAILIIMTNFGAYLACFLTIGAGFGLLEILDMGNNAAQGSWMFGASPLTQGTVVLVSGRLGSVYGHKRLVVVGGVVLVVTNLVNGFCTSWNAFIGVRAMNGIGAGLLSPNVLALVTTTIPPGKTRNLFLALFGASSPLGAWGSSFISGLVMRYTKEWKWAFIIVGLYNFVSIILVVVFVHNDGPIDKTGTFDYLGAALGMVSMAMFAFTWNESPIVGWQEWWIILILVLSVVIFGVFLWWEHKAVDPVIPIHAFRVPTFVAIITAAAMGTMAHGIFMWYLVAWDETIRGADALTLSLHWLPFAIGAVLGTFLVAWMIRRASASATMNVGVITILGGCILMATMPEHQTYWAQTFPAVFLDGLSPDPIFVAAQIIASNSVSRKDQGAAGSLIAVINMYGQALGVGMAGQIDMHVKSYAGNTRVDGYRAALIFGAALAAVGLVVNVGWVRMDKDRTEGWGVEDEEYARQHAARVAAAAAAQAEQRGDIEKGVKT